MRFEIKHNSNDYYEIEKYLNGFFINNHTHVRDIIVSFQNPDGRIFTEIFSEDCDCGWINCMDDYIEDQAYIDILGFLPVDSLYIYGGSIVSKGWGSDELQNIYREYLRLEESGNQK